MRLLLIILTIFATMMFAQHPSFDPRYHTVDEVINEIFALADTYSAYCHLESLGVSSVDSIVIWGVKISDNPTINEDEAVVAFIGGQHADEPQNTEAAMWLLKDLLRGIARGDGRYLRWWENLEIWIVPQMNPDGRRMCLDSGYVDWRKTKRDNNGNGIYEAYTDGVDPNRNWDYQWDEFVSEDIDNFKGPYPWSESEVVAMRDFFLRERPLSLIDYHSPDSTGGNKLWICWYFTAPYSGWAPDANYGWKEIRDSLAAKTIDETGTDTYNGLASYQTKPKLQNWIYFNIGTCSIVMEITNQQYWTGEIIDSISARVARGSTYLLDRALERVIVVHVVDTSGAPITDAKVDVVQLRHSYLPIRTVDPIHGTSRRMVQSGYYHIEVSRRGYFPVRIDSIRVAKDSISEITVVLDRDYSIDERSLPEKTNIKARPNPFNSSCEISGFESGGEAEIFDINGKLIKKIPIQNTFKSSGNKYIAVWDATNLHGIDVPSGIYFAKKSKDFAVCKLMLIR